MTSGCIGALTVGLAGALVCFLSGANDKETAALDRDEARKAFEYLNRIRKEPAKFSNLFSLVKNLNTVSSSLMQERFGIIHIIMKRCR